MSNSITPPLRTDLERICNGNQRSVKAFEELFRLLGKISSQVDDIDTLATQISADNALSQSNQALAIIAEIQKQIELNALCPATELNQSDQIFPVYQAIGCNNFNLEIT